MKSKDKGQVMRRTNFRKPAVEIVAIAMIASAIAVPVAFANAGGKNIGAVAMKDYLGATARDEESVSRQIKYADQVYATDMVETDAGGATELQFLDNTRLTVGANAKVKLDDFVYDPASELGAGQISLALGAFRYVGGDMKNEEKLKLVTPTATLTIRGTRLIIYVGENGNTEVNVISGAVAVAACGGGGGALLGGGQSASVSTTCSMTVASVRPGADADEIPELPRSFGDESGNPNDANHSGDSNHKGGGERPGPKGGGGGSGGGGSTSG